MPTFYVTVGIPCSGKTTYIQSGALGPNVCVVSPDEVRRQMNGHVLIQENMEEVWSLCYSEIEDKLRLGKDVVLDSTQYRQCDRQNLISTLRPFSDNIVGLYFQTSYLICLWRNGLRLGRVIPENAMKRMKSILEKEPPVTEDGFDEIKIIKF